MNLHASLGLGSTTPSTSRLLVSPHNRQANKKLDSSSSLEMSAEYEIPRPNRIHLKETAQEKAERIYRKEERRQRREDERIARANNQAGPSDEQARTERYRQQLRDQWRRDEQIRARRNQRQTRAEFVNDMDDFEPGLFGSARWGEALNNLRNFGLGGFGVPPRYRPRSQSPPLRSRGFGAPPMGNMGPDEYAAFIRAQFRAQRRGADSEEAARRAREAWAENERRYRDEILEEERAERDAKRRRRARADAAAEDAARAARINEAETRASRAEEEAAQREERARWRKRCATLFDAEILSVNLRFEDIPWPVASARGSGFGIVITPADLTLENVKSFLFALAHDEGAKDRRKVIRDAIRLFHSDRFHSRVLPRVREEERAKVKEGVEVVARILTDLLSA